MKTKLEDSRIVIIAETDEEELRLNALVDLPPKEQQKALGKMMREIKERILDDERENNDD